MFDKETWIRLPRNVLVGHGVLGETAAAVGELHLSGLPLVVTSPTPRSAAGDRVIEELATLGPDPELIVVEEATFDAIERVLARTEDVDPGYTPVRPAVRTRGVSSIQSKNEPAGAE